MIEQTSAYVYNGWVDRVVDGDTIDVTLYLADRLDAGFGISVTQTHKVRLRLAAINAPEMRTPEGVAARDRLRELLPDGALVTVHTVKDRTEKFGRYLGWVGTLKDGLINDLMVHEGHAEPFLVSLAGRPESFPPFA